ncbi:FkbM family methyltransferase [Azospirillum sp. B2RO_4]|uniref:FkbM family methyltransferase n=1 Tax=Azospirillum sp. B2RO_4 TaxID=3027796 RepID=UPI003DA9F092
MGGAFWRKARKLARLLGNPAFRRGLRFGVAAAIEHRTILGALPVATVIDVGANTGQFSLLAASLYRNAAIHAVEPLPAAAAVFTRLFADSARVRLYRVAAGAGAANAPLHVSRRHDCSSLLPIAGGQTDFAPGTEAVGTITVPVRPLDELIAPDDLVRPVLLKLDVQGGELQALQGAGRLLAAVDHVYVEVSFLPLYDGQPLAHAVVEHLAGQGFGLAGTNHPTFDRAGRCVQVDLLFSRLPAAATHLHGRPATEPGLRENGLRETALTEAGQEAETAPYPPIAAASSPSLAMASPADCGRT